MSRSAHRVIKVAVGILTNHENKILVARRPLHYSHGGYWEFPGGKFEKGETAFQALQRELFEEIGVTVIEAKPLICLQHNYRHVSVELNTWVVTHYENIPYGKEGQFVQWVEVDVLPELRFPEGNITIIQKIQETF